MAVITISYISHTHTLCITVATPSRLRMHPYLHPCTISPTSAWIAKVWVYLSDKFYCSFVQVAWWSPLRRAAACLYKVNVGSSAVFLHDSNPGHRTGPLFVSWMSTASTSTQLNFRLCVLRITYDTDWCTHFYGMSFVPIPFWRHLSSPHLSCVDIGFWKPKNKS